MSSLLQRDAQKGNILDQIDTLLARVRILEEQSGVAGGDSGGSVLIPADDSGQVRVSHNDALAGYLGQKLVADSPITLIEQGDGGNETLLLTMAAHLTPDAHHAPVAIGAGGLSGKLAVNSAQVLTLAAISHGELTGIGPDDHHNRVAIGAGGLSSKLAVSPAQVLTLAAINHSELSNIGPDDHHNRVAIGAGGLSGKLAVSPGQVLTLAAISHGELTGIGPDDHHNRVAIGAGGLSGKLAVSPGQVLTLAAINHSELSNIGPDDHHNRVAIGAGGLSGKLAVNSAQVLTLAAINHSELSNIGPDDHHSRVHGITGADHTVAGAALDVVGLTAVNTLGLLTPASSPGAAERLLKTASDGSLTLRHLTLTDDLIVGRIDSDALPKTTAVHSLGSTSLKWRELHLSGAVHAGSGAISGALDVGGDLTVGVNTLRVHANGQRVGINRAADPQFQLDVQGNLRASGYIVGQHAIQLSDALMICHYDGARLDDDAGNATGHLGQVATIYGPTVFRPGRFGKAVLLGNTTPDPLVVGVGEEFVVTGKVTASLVTSSGLLEVTDGACLMVSEGVGIGADALRYDGLLARSGTVLLWWKPLLLATTGRQTLFRQGSLSAYYNASSGSLELTNGVTTAVAPLSPIVGAWGFYGFVWGAGELQIWVNPISTAPAATAVASPIEPGGAFYVGGEPLEAGSEPPMGNTATGLLDELVVVGRALEADLIRAIYESNSPVFAESSTWSFQLPNSLVFADEEGLWMRTAEGAAAFGMVGVEGKSWGGLLLGAGDLLVGNTASNYIHFDASTGQLSLTGNGSGLTSINGSNIETGTITAAQIATGSITTNELNFTPVDSDHVVAAINASAEGLTINTARLNLTGVLMVGGAAGDVNAGTTTIDGDRITTGTVTADRLDVAELSAISADLGTVTAGHISGATIEAGAGVLVLDDTGMRLIEPTTLVDIYLDADTKVGSFGMMNTDAIRIWRSQIKRTNIFPNPSFEDPVSGWVDVGDSEFDRVSTQAHTGAYSLVCIHYIEVAAVGPAYSRSPSIELSGDTQAVYLNLAVKAASGNIPQSRVLLQWVDAKGYIYQEHPIGSHLVNFSTDWRKYDLFSIKPADATHVRLAVGEHTGTTVPMDAGMFILYLDSVQLSESPSTQFTYLDVGSSRIDINRALGLRAAGTPIYVDDQANIYVRNNRLIVQYRDPGYPPTTRYKYLQLSGTGVSWVHSTTPP